MLQVKHSLVNFSAFSNFNFFFFLQSTIKKEAKIYGKRGLLISHTFTGLWSLPQQHCSHLLSDLVLHVSPYPSVSSVLPKLRFFLTLLWFFFLLFSKNLFLPDTCVQLGFIWVQLIKSVFHLGRVRNRHQNSTGTIRRETLKYRCSVLFPFCSLQYPVLVCLLRVYLELRFCFQKKIPLHVFSIHKCFFFFCVEAYSYSWS